MSEDARFEDGDDKALNIGAFDQRDLEVISSLIQDSIFPTSEIKWLKKANKLALLINRFRWEDKSLARLSGNVRHDGPTRNRGTSEWASWFCQPNGATA